MISDIRSCAFTGHRPGAFPFGYDETNSGYIALRKKLQNAIIQVCNAGCRRFFCGMAEGVDLWCGELVLELKDRYDPPLEIIPVVPYFSQPDSMSSKNKERYRRIMNAFPERYLVSREFTKSCFQKRNFFMVDSSDAIIAVLMEGKEHSGTGQTLRYAKKKKKKIFLIQ